MTPLPSVAELIVANHSNELAGRDNRPPNPPLVRPSSIAGNFQAAPSKLSLAQVQIPRASSHSHHHTGPSVMSTGDLPPTSSGPNPMVLPPLNRRLTDPLENYSTDKRVSVSSSITSYSRNPSASNHLDPVALEFACSPDKPVPYVVPINSATNSSTASNSTSPTVAAVGDSAAKLPPIKHLKLHEVNNPSPHYQLHTTGPHSNPASNSHSRSNSYSLQHPQQLPPVSQCRSPPNALPPTHPASTPVQAPSKPSTTPGPPPPYFSQQMVPNHLPPQYPAHYVHHYPPQLTPGMNPATISPSGPLAPPMPVYNGIPMNVVPFGMNQMGHMQHMNMNLPMWLEENHALVHKRRIIKRRTRTGCLTCRKRRIKCDERRPHCYNCERSRKECLGYENLNKKKNQDKENAHDDHENEHDNERDNDNGHDDNDNTSITHSS